MRATTLPALPIDIRLSPEFSLLARCCSPVINGAYLGASLSAMNWAEFAKLARRHQVEPLVHATLSRCAPQVIGADTRRRALLMSARSLRHANELIRLNRAFVENKLDLIHLKGILLSLRLFGEAGMRHVRDIDLLVRPQDLAVANRLLRTLGYDGPLSKPLAQRLMPSLSHDHHLAYRHPDSQISVELHWRFYLWRQEEVAELWSHRETTNWMGSDLTQLDSKALLLVLCAHGSGHRWSHLKWLADVARLLAERRDFDASVSLAKRLKLTRPLAQAALLSHWLFGIELQDELCELIQEERSCAELAKTALKAMQLEARQTRGRTRHWRYFMRLRAASRGFTREPIEFKPSNPVNLRLECHHISFAIFVRIHPQTN
jgi:hypothetical protein